MPRRQRFVYMNVIYKYREIKQDVYQYVPTVGVYRNRPRFYVFMIAVLTRAMVLFYKIPAILLAINTPLTDACISPLVRPAPSPPKNRFFIEILSKLFSTLTTLE